MPNPKIKPSCTFSIIMSCYNSEAYLRNAVSSLLNQSYPDWELIAVNDGSRDSTLAILQEYALHDHRIKVFSKENGGYTSAVNFGLEKMAGDYFLLLGSDDALAPDLLSELRLCADAQDPDCIAWRSVFVQEGRILEDSCGTDFTDAVCMSNTKFAQYLHTYPLHAKILCTRDTSKCYKRSLLGNLRYFGQYGYDADGIFSMLLCHNAHSFAALPVDGYYWTLREDSLSGRKTFFAQEVDRVQNWVDFFSHLRKLDASEISSVEINYLYYFIDILGRTWKSPECALSHYPLIRDAVRSVRALCRKTQVSLSLGAEDRLLLHFPAIWRAYTALPCNIRSILRK